MSVNLPLRHLLRTGSALPVFARSSRQQISFPFRTQVPRRTLFGFLKRSREEPKLDPLSEKYTRAKQKDNAIAQGSNRQGGLAAGSILDDGTAPSTKLGEPAAEAKDVSPGNRDPVLMSPILDPRPKARMLWERKMLIKSIRKRGRINKTTLLARTERQHLAKSQMFKGSIKKLMPLARQIAGKPLEDAITQMRFSKKKVAQDILKHLERARDEAVVRSGMGLGKLRKASGDENSEPLRMVVQDKKGVRRLVTDKTAMYIDQAWINRGQPEYGLDHRARGQIHRLTKAYTNISVLLKEEQTRIREMNERADKEAAKKTWVQLPDRPVTRQTQYPLW